MSFLAFFALVLYVLLYVSGMCVGCLLDWVPWYSMFYVSLMSVCTLLLALYDWESNNELS